MTTTWDWIFVALLFAVVVATPFIGRWDQHRFERRLAAGDTEARARAFALGIRFQWIVAVLLFEAWWFSSFDAESVFLVPGWGGGEWVALAVGVLFCILAIAQTRMLAGRPERLGEVREKLGTIAMWAPRTVREQRLFDGLSVTAGICEEFAYRGLLLGVLASVIGLWPAVLVSSVAFGLAHAYQGAAGVVRTGAVGLVFALMTVFSGSIWIAVVAHAVLDLAQGRMIAMAVRDAEPAAQT